MRAVLLSKRCFKILSLNPPPTTLQGIFVRRCGTQLNDLWDFHATNYRLCLKDELYYVARRKNHSPKSCDQSTLKTLEKPPFTTSYLTEIGGSDSPRTNACRNLESAAAESYDSKSRMLIIYSMLQHITFRKTRKHSCRATIAYLKFQCSGSNRSIEPQ